MEDYLKNVHEKYNNLSDKERVIFLEKIGNSWPMVTTTDFHRVCVYFGLKDYGDYGPFVPPTEQEIKECIINDVRETIKRLKRNLKSYGYDISFSVNIADADFVDEEEEW